MDMDPSPKPKESPLWVALLALGIMVGFLFLIGPSRSAGVLANKFDLKPQIGGKLPLDVKLTESDGKEKFVGEYLRKGRPMVLVPIFYNCNGVCFTELDSLTKMLVKEVAVSTKKTVDSVVPGRDFELVVVSLHPKETADLARSKKAEFIQVFRDGWKLLSSEQRLELEKTLIEGVHYTVGEESEVKRLTESMGFYYTYDEKKNWVFHPAAAAYVATSGLISGYNTGPTFATKTVRTSVIDAAEAKVQPLGSPMLLGCFKMEANSPRTAAIVRSINAACVITVLALGVFIWRWNRKHPSNTLKSKSGGE